MSKKAVAVLLIEDDEALRRTHPKAKIVAISGGGRNTADDYLRIAKATSAHRVLAKPFLPKELIQLVPELLAEPTA